MQLQPWSHSSDRELDVANRHSRDYYHHADQLLRDEVALSRGSTAADEFDALRARIDISRHALQVQRGEGRQ